MQSAVRRVRFSLEFLVILVLPCGVLLAVLKAHGIAPTAILVFYFVLVWASVKAVAERRGKRAFWVGFTIVGWPCLIALGLLFRSLTRTAAIQSCVRALYAESRMWTVHERNEAMATVVIVAQSTITILFALIGGVVAKRLFGHRVNATASELMEVVRSVPSERSDVPRARRS